MPSTHQITANPATLTFTSTNWNTAQTVTLTTPTDTSGIDEQEVFQHTAASTDSKYSGATGKVTATQTDTNSAPTSADFTFYADPAATRTRTELNPASADFTFTDADGDTKYAIIIESLPDAAQGELKLYRRGKTTGICRIFPKRQQCLGVEEPVFVGQWALPQDDSSTASTLNFYPASSFTGQKSATFKYKMVDNTGNISTNEYTVTIKPKGSAPSKPARFRVTAGNTEVDLAWTAINDSSVTKIEYTYKKLTDTIYASWTEICNTSAKCQAATSQTVTGLTNGVAYHFLIRATNPGGSTATDAVAATPAILPAPSGLAATGQATQINLAWTASANASITGYQIRQREGNLDAFPGNAEVELHWDNPNDTTITGWEYRYKAAGTYGSWTAIPNSGASTATHTVDSLTNATAHTFQVRPVRGANEGTALNDATATPSTSAAYGWADIASSGQSTASHSVTTGVTAGKSYAYQIRAADSVGPGAPTGWVKSALLPAKPAGLTATPGNTNVTLAWTDPNDATISKWQYQQDSGDWTDIANSGASTTSYVVTGLTNDTAYAFKIRAVNDGGDGPQSDASTPATPRDNPPAPTGFTASGKVASADLAWTNPNDSLITAYEYRHSESNGGLTAFPLDKSVELSWNATTNPTETDIIEKWQYSTDGSTWTDIANSDEDTTSATIGGLTNGKEYDFQIKAIPATFTIKGLTAAGGDQQVVLTWYDPSEPSISKWQYRYAKLNAILSDWIDIPSSDATTETHTIASLTNGATYKFQVRALSSKDPVPGSTLLGYDEAQKRYTIATPFAAVTPSAEVTITPPGWTAISGSGATTVAHTVASLDNAKRYDFQIRARRDNSLGAASDKAAATPAALTAKPTGLTAVSGENATVTLKWPTANAATSWEFSKDDGSTWTAITPTTVGTDYAYQATGLTNGTAYTFKVRGVNANAQAGPESDGATATPRLLPAPTGLTAAPRDGRLNLSWTNPGDSTIVRYQFQVTEKGVTRSDSAWKTVPSSSATTTSHYVVDLTNETAYDYYLRAVNAAGQNGAAAKVTATPYAPPSAPTGLIAKVSSGQIALTWTDPSNDTITRWQYRIDGGDWKEVKTAVVNDPTELTFNSTNYNVDKSFKTKLPAAPSVGVKITFEQIDKVTGIDGVFTPSTLTFTTQNWDNGADCQRAAIGAAAGRSGLPVPAMSDSDTAVAIGRAVSDS